MADQVELFAGVTINGVDCYANEILSADAAAIVLEYLSAQPQYRLKRKSPEQYDAEVKAQAQMFLDEKHPGRATPGWDNPIDEFSTEAPTTFDIIQNYGRELGEQLRARAVVWKREKVAAEAAEAASRSIRGIEPVSVSGVVEPTAMGE